MVHRRIQARGFLGAAIVGALVVSALVVVPGAAASAASPAPLRHLASGPLPAVTPIPAHAGSHGYPYDAVPTKSSFPGAPTINLAHFGYVEREFKMSGTTNIYQQSGFWGSNGMWNVSVAQRNVPYTTRLLVRYPTNPAKFNGTVVVEWLNDTTGGDQDPVWSEIYHEVLVPGVRLCRRLRADRQHGRGQDLGPAALRLAGRQQRRAVLRHLQPGGAGGPGGRREPARWPEAGHGHRRGRLAVGVPGGHLLQRDPAAQPRVRWLPCGRPRGARGADRQRPGRVLAVPGAHPHRQHDAVPPDRDRGRHRGTGIRVRPAARQRPPAHLGTGRGGAHRPARGAVRGRHDSAGESAADGAAMRVRRDGQRRDAARQHGRVRA